VSAGCPMPLDPTPREPAGVIILSAEDGLADTVRPRLEAAGADGRGAAAGIGSAKMVRIVRLGKFFRVYFAGW